MSITTVGSNLIHYEVLGRGNPTVFIHGWLGSWRYWWPTMQGLSARHRSFAFDLWGFGDSSKATSMYSMRAYVEMLHQFIDKLGISTPVNLVGHALGAVVALNYTKLNPDAVSKLAAVSLPVNGGNLHEQLASSAPDDFINKVLGKSNSFSEVDGEVRKTDQQAMNQSAQEVMSNNYVSDLDGLPRPVLLVFGDEDMVVTPPSGDYHHLQKASNNRLFISLDNCTHFPMLQETAKFNRLLLDFLAAQGSLKDIAPKEYWRRRTR